MRISTTEMSYVLQVKSHTNKYTTPKEELQLSYSTLEHSVADPDPNPDPYAFGPLGSRSGSISERYGSGSGSGSFYHQKK
jgi:hypothetical protein